MKPPLSLIPLLLLFALAACDFTGSDRQAAGASALAASTADEEEIGNNLSFPVIWGDGPSYTLPLRGDPDHPRFDGDFFDWGGEQWYVQGDSLNEWQAETAAGPLNPRGPDEFIVNAVDWGDNLEARAWPHGQQVRVEVSLLAFLDRPMQAFTMRSENPDVHGPNEVWGTNGEVFLTDTAMVYSAGVQLVIQRLAKSREDPTLNVSWNGRQWTGDIDAPAFSQGVWEGGEGPGRFGIEVNAKGRVIYGLNWQTGGMKGAGDYRITFVFQPNAPVNLNTRFDRHSYVIQPDEHLTAAAPGDGGTARLNWRRNITYIDVRLTGGN